MDTDFGDGQVTVVEIIETEAQAAARVRLARARKALTSAPMLAYQLRWDATPLDGRTERGILRELRTPLLTGVTDAADELYVELQRWVLEWAVELQVASPEGWSWRNIRTGAELGLRADASPETAHNLVTSASAWLLWHENAIARLEGAEVYHDDVAGLIWAARGAAGLIRPHRKSDVVTIATRPCPNPMCGAVEVRVEYFGEPMAYAIARGERLSPTPIGSETEEQAANYFASAIAGVSVRCGLCGWSPELRPSQIARWLS